MATRRGNGEGTIRERSGRPGYIGELRYVDPVTGKPSRKSVYGPTKEDVRRKLRDARKIVESGKAPKTGATTFHELANRYMSVELPRLINAGRMSEATAESKRIHLRKHALPLIDEKAKLVDMTVAAIKELDYKLGTELAIKPDKSGNPTAPRNSGTRRQALIAVRGVLDMAVEEQLIAANNARSVPLPRNVRVKAKPVPFEVDAIARILEATKDSRLAALWVVLLSTGCRRQDAVAARWSDIDLKAGTWALWQETEGKTPAATRTVALSTACVKSLKAHKKKQAAERLKAISWADADVVFATPLGTPYVPHSVTKLVERELTRLGLKGTPHLFRHTSITSQLAAGVSPADIAAQVGHESAEITLTVYAHGTMGGTRAAAETLDAYLGL